MLAQVATKQVRLHRLAFGEHFANVREETRSKLSLKIPYVMLHGTKCSWNMRVSSPACSKSTHISAHPDHCRTVHVEFMAVLCMYLKSDFISLLSPVISLPAWWEKKVPGNGEAVSEHFALFFLGEYCWLWGWFFWFSFLVIRKSGRCISYFSRLPARSRRWCPG